MLDTPVVHFGGRILIPKVHAVPRSFLNIGMLMTVWIVDDLSPPVCEVIKKPMVAATVGTLVALAKATLRPLQTFAKLKSKAACK